MAPRLRPLLTLPNDGTQMENKLDLRVALKKGAGLISSKTASSNLKPPPDQGRHQLLVIVLMGVTPIQAKIERKRQDRSARRVEKRPPGPRCRGFTGRFAQLRAFARPQTPLGRKTLDHLAQLGDRDIRSTSIRESRLYHADFLMIDREFFLPRPSRYYRDFLAYLSAFLAAFVWGIQADWSTVILPWLLAVLSLHRAGLFCHEVVHSKHSSLRVFRVLYSWTVALIVMVPPIRFGLPHLAHHRLGVFGTHEDPQYPLVRGNAFALTMVLVIIPFVVPFTNLLMIVTGALGAFRFEQALDRWSTETLGFSLSSELDADQQGEVKCHARVTLLLFLIFVTLMPGALLFYYAVLVGGWALITARIPLEHELETLADASGPNDQMADSFTIESPLALLIQPIGFRFHTAHHMYPGVPYHNLSALHEELKRTSPEYRNSIISLWAAIRGPKPVR